MQKKIDRLRCKRCICRNCKKLKKCSPCIKCMYGTLDLTDKDLSQEECKKFKAE